jgi:hypothetical protein
MNDDQTASGWPSATLDVATRESFANRHRSMRDCAAYRVVGAAGQEVMLRRAAFTELCGQCAELVELRNGMRFLGESRFSALR